MNYSDIISAIDRVRTEDESPEGCIIELCTIALVNVRYNPSIDIETRAVLYPKIIEAIQRQVDRM